MTGIRWAARRQPEVVRAAEAIVARVDPHRRVDAVWVLFWLLTLPMCAAIEVLAGIEMARVL